MKRNRMAWLCLLVFAAVALMSAAATFAASGTLLDGDASAELVLAEHLSRTNRILSEDWFYSTELRVVNTQLVFALLFKFFDSWRLVRFAGAMLLQGIYILSYAYFARQAGVKRQAFWLSAAGLLLPVSISYGRIALYHSYYIPHLTLGFLMAGLLICVDSRVGRDGWKAPSAVRALLMMALSLLSGLGGIRQAFHTQIPLLAAVLLYWLKLDREAEERGGAGCFALVRRPLALAVGACAFFGIGFLINHFVLAQRYQVMSFEGVSMKVLDFSALDDLVYGFFHLFGYRKGAEALSLMGVLSLCSIPAGGYSLYLGATALVRRIRGEGLGEFVAEVFFPISLAVMLCVFLFSSMQFEFIRYLIPAAVWVAPMMAVRWRTAQPGRIYARNVLCLCVVALMCASGLGNVKYVMSERRGGQIYEGLTGAYTNANLVRSMSGAVNFLEESGYTHGYIGGGGSNLVAEMTDGRVRMVSFSMDGARTRMGYYDWLTLREYREVAPEEDVILLTNAQAELFAGLEVSEGFETVYEDKHCKVLLCEEGGTLKAYLDAQPTISRSLDE